mmetsp:Transcript_141757/g.452838  ORF Transcript_141757/g.452838 Transcript_141757/m.452838 type:complete len:668 (-) Transcript_141757:103-2106(-)
MSLWTGRAPKEITHPGACSYKELISKAATVAGWFCSHWWGESVFDFVACCEQHAACRALSENEASYWVCGYANRQHDLGSDLSKDPSDSSFNKAMLVAKGILVILDSDAVPFARIWCDFEIFMTQTRQTKLMDVVTCHKGRARVLSEGLLPDETPTDKTTRERRFPLELLSRGLTTQLERGDASVEIDKIRILNNMSSNSQDLDNPEILQTVQDWPGNLQCFRSVNADLRAAFAVAAWPQAVHHGIVKDFDVARPGVVSLPRVLASALNRKILQLSFEGLHCVTDEELHSLASGLPPKLQVLNLGFNGCQGITDTGVGYLAERIQTLHCLDILELRFFGIVALTGASLQSLGEALPWNVKDIMLDFSESLGGEGSFDAEGAAKTDIALETLMHSLPRDLERFALCIGNCKTLSLTGYKTVVTTFPSTLSTLELDLTGLRDLSQKGDDEHGLPNCDIGCLTDELAVHLVQRLPKNLHKLLLHIGRHKKLTPNFADAFAEWLSTAQALEELHMQFYMGNAAMSPIGQQGMKTMWSHLPQCIKALSLLNVGRHRQTAVCIGEHLPSNIQHLRVIADKEYHSLADILDNAKDEQEDEVDTRRLRLPLPLRRLPAHTLRSVGDALGVLKQAGLSSVRSVEDLHRALEVLKQAGLSDLSSVADLQERVEHNSC